MLKFVNMLPYLLEAEKETGYISAVCSVFRFNFLIVTRLYYLHYYVYYTLYIYYIKLKNKVTYLQTD